MIGYVNHGDTMPPMLEVALLCDDWHISPDKFGFEVADPKTVRTMRAMLNIYRMATDRKNSPKKSDWDKDNPEQRGILNWAIPLYQPVTVPNADQPRMPIRE